jgi:hypothetical protein
VIQAASRARFTAESRQVFGIRGPAEDLEGDVSLQARVVGAVDLAHPARADRCDDLVGTEMIAG